MKMAGLAMPLVALGICVTLVGLGLDAALHKADPDLSAEEGVFALANPGHDMLWAGLLLTVCGVAISVFTWNNNHSLARRVAPIAALFSLATASVALAATEPDEGSHNDGSTFVHEGGEEHGEAEHAQVLAAQTTEGPEVAGEGSDQNRHDAGQEIALTVEDYDLLQSELAAARAATEKYKDWSVALADGYEQTTSFLPETGMHMTNFSIRGFDPARPPILLYEPDADGAGWTLVGVAYGMPFKERAPRGFSGPLDVWHYHTNRCTLRNLDVVTAESGIDCYRMGGRFVRQGGWTLHAWLFKDSPTGIFSHQNPLLGQE